MSAQLAMSADEMTRAVARLALEIVERHRGADGLALIGIQRRGAVMAHRLTESIADSASAWVDFHGIEIDGWDGVALTRPPMPAAIAEAGGPGTD